MNEPVVYLNDGFVPASQAHLNVYDLYANETQQTGRGESGHTTGYGSEIGVGLGRKEPATL